MIEVLTVINTIAIIGFILLQIAIFRSGKPKMDHLTQWMKKQEAINRKLINEIEMLIDKLKEKKRKANESSQ